MFHFDSYIKTGICTLLSTSIYYFTGHIVNHLFNLTENYYEVDFYNWEQYSTGNVFFIIAASLFLVSTVFIGIGVFRIYKSKSR